MTITLANSNASNESFRNDRLISIDDVHCSLATLLQWRFINCTAERAFAAQKARAKADLVALWHHTEARRHRLAQLRMRIAQRRQKKISELHQSSRRMEKVKTETFIPTHEKLLDTLKYEKIKNQSFLNSKFKKRHQNRANDNAVDYSSFQNALRVVSTAVEKYKINQDFANEGNEENELRLGFEVNKLSDLLKERTTKYISQKNQITNLICEEFEQFDFAVNNMVKV